MKAVFLIFAGMVISPVLRGQNTLVSRSKVFGPPSFEKANVSITTGEQEHVIRVKYF